MGRIEFILKKILKEESENQKPLSRGEIILFKQLNKKKKELKTKSNILEYIKDLSKILDLDSNRDKYYYALWKSNFRENGDYQNITFDEFVGPEDLPSVRVTNPQSSEYSSTKSPFRGANLLGRWGKDNNGVKYYEVVSYNWYPIYLFKQGRWYKITNTYSSSTARQMSNANPIDYDERVGTDVIWVTKQEMDMLKHNDTYEDIMKNKVSGLVKSKEDFISKKPKFATSYRGYDDETPASKVRFKVTDIREENGKAVVDVTIDDAGTRERRPTNGQLTNRMIPSQGGYLRGEIPGLSKESVEKIIKNKILTNFKDFVGKIPNWSSRIGYDIESTPDKHAIKFNFIHTKEQ